MQTQHRVSDVSSCFLWLDDFGWNLRCRRNTCDKAKDRNATTHPETESSGAFGCFPPTHMHLQSHIEINGQAYMYSSMLIIHAWVETSTDGIHTRKSTHLSLKVLCVSDSLWEFFGYNRKSLYTTGALISLFPVETPGQIGISSSWSHRKLSEPHIKTSLSRECLPGMSCGYLLH